MSRSDFCDERAQRMKTLAEDSADPDVRVHLTKMAKNWMRQAKANENEKTRLDRPVKSAQGPAKNEGSTAFKLRSPKAFKGGKRLPPRTASRRL
jgi:hypothetical protein